MDIDIVKWQDEIYKFYENNLPELPPNPGFRYFKFVWKYPVRTARHIRDRIYTPEHLRQYALRDLPQHVYYSLTTWLNPTTVHGRKSIAIPLWSDLVFDVDAGNIKIARSETLKLIRYLKSMGYRKFKVLFSGHKGFHVYVQDFKYDRYPEDPRERGAYFEKVKKKIHEEILSEGIGIDPNLWDLYRVVRVPNTLNATTMLPAFWVKSLKNLHRFGDKVRIRPKYPSKPVKIYASTLLVTSHVLGTSDRHVLFLDLDNADYNKATSIAEKLISEEDLPLVAVFKTFKGYNLWSPVALRFSHVIRLKKKYGDDPKHIYLMKKRGFDTIRIKEKVFTIGIVHDAPQPSELLIDQSKTKYPLALGHLLLLQALFGIRIRPFYNYTTGRPHVKIVPAVSKVEDARFLTRYVKLSR